MHCTILTLSQLYGAAVLQVGQCAQLSKVVHPLAVEVGSQARAVATVRLLKCILQQVVDCVLGYMLKK